MRGPRLDFGEIIHKGKKYPGNAVTLYILRAKDKSGIGIAVGKRLGSATTRNRARRIIREIIRLTRPQLEPGFRIVISARRNVLRNSFDQNVLEYLKLLEKAGCCRRENS